MENDAQEDAPHTYIALMTDYLDLETLYSFVLTHSFCFLVDSSMHTTSLKFTKNNGVVYCAGQVADYSYWCRVVAL